MGVYRFYLFTFADREFGFGLLTRFENPALVAAAGLQGDPFDVVLGKHRMLYGADGDFYDVVFNCENGLENAQKQPKISGKSHEVTWKITIVEPEAVML